jgi:hypothetical protein
MPLDTGYSNMGRGGGVGAQGLPYIDQAEKDKIQEMSDAAQRVASTQPAAMEANTANNLRAATGGGGKMQPALVEQAAEAILDQYRDKTQQRKIKMGELSTRIMEMEKQAKIAHDTTGNMVASNTYMQVAKILKSRLHALQSEDVGVTATSQPAGGQ